MDTLGDSTEWIYDFTIGYPGVKPEENPEDVYTIPSIFFYNHFPQKVHIYIRRYRIRDIPKESSEAFSSWLYERWVEKDHMMSHFYSQGRFPGERVKECVQVPVRLNNSITELLQIWLFLLPYIPLLRMLSMLYNRLANNTVL